MRNWKVNLLRVFAGLPILLLIACNGKPVILQPAVNSAKTPTPLIAGTFSPITTDVPIEASTTPLPTRSLDPLKFTFPTPEKVPISLWRPPLYPRPWALGPYDHFFFARPIAADVVNWPLANYRYGAVWPGKPDIMHTGIDIDAPKGTPILAAAPGKVIWAGYGLYLGTNDPRDPYGQAVTVMHDFGYKGAQIYTIYAHMDKILAINGQRVETGTVLGLVGDTGNTTGPHLHFEVRLIGNSFFATYNPELWLAPPEGWGVLVGQIRNTNGSLLTQQEVIVKSRATRQKWSIASYGSHTINSDDYYKENVVLSDLPAGDYDITIDYLGESFSTETTIYPGAISYFTFRGKDGFGVTHPPAPSQNVWAASTSP
jgi:murein DD-endopeptidase MepM/ murein hydrolase activator NlpD